jgi:hypothetical protein
VQSTFFHKKHVSYQPVHSEIQAAYIYSHTQVSQPAMVGSRIDMI